MKFEKTQLEGVYLIKPEKLEDERGFFSRSFCQLEFSRYNLSTKIAQCSTSFNKKKGTFRGMHYQVPPFEEEKIVMCPRGAIMDFVIDLRKDSPTYTKWISHELSEENLFMIYIPKSFAHGFITLTDDTLVSYMMTEFHYAPSARGFRWNDPAFNLKLPLDIEVISDRDKFYDDFDKTLIDQALKVQIDDSVLTH